MIAHLRLQFHYPSMSQLNLPFSNYHIQHFLIGSTSPWETDLQVVQGYSDKTGPELTYEITSLQSWCFFPPVKLAVWPHAQLLWVKKILLTDRHLSCVGVHLVVILVRRKG